MGLPFVIVEGAIFIADEGGRIAEVTVGKRLKTEVIFAEDGNVIPSIGSGLLYEDMNPTVGGIARDTAVSNIWQTVYSVLGKGNFIGFILTLEKIKDPWIVKLTIDGVEVFGANGISTEDLQDDTIYGFNRSTAHNISEWLGFEIKDNTLRYEGPNNLPLRYKTSISIQVKKSGGSKKFRAGLVNRTSV